jgi:hypothetical protein
MICFASSINTGLQKPNFSMLLAICRTCRRECVRALFGYPEKESGLSKIALQRMFKEADPAGLITDKERVAVVLGQSGQGYAAPNASAKMHESLTGWWRAAEFVPKRHYNWELKKEEKRANLFRRRTIADHSLVHQSAYTAAPSTQSGSRPTPFLCRGDGKAERPWPRRWSLASAGFNRDIHEALAIEAGFKIGAKRLGPVQPFFFVQSVIGKVGDLVGVQFVRVRFGVADAAWPIPAMPPRFPSCRFQRRLFISTLPSTTRW